MKGYKLITVNHKLLNTEDLQHFIIRHKDKEELHAKLIHLKEAFDQDEVLYLSTCNRVMYLFFGEAPIKNTQKTDFFFQINDGQADVSMTNVDRIIQCYQGLDAVNHLYEVAASIDSLVVGEREIFRQFREAYDWCREVGLCRDKMRLLAQSTVKAAKEVYTRTEIGAKPVSVVSLAIQEFLKRDLAKDVRILLVGAGETNSTAGRFLKKHGYRNIVIFNRSLDNAQKLSDELGAEARYLGTLGEHAGGFDVIFACTGAQDPIVTTEVFEQIKGDDRTKLLIDLSIPHNIADDVAEMDQVDYISIDSIRDLANENLKFRSGNIAAARIILARHKGMFEKLYDQRRVEIALGQLPSAINEVKDRALNVVYKEKIATMPAEAQALIAEIAAYMEKKCVAAPMKIVREELVG